MHLRGPFETILKCRLTYLSFRSMTAVVMVETIGSSYGNRCETFMAELLKACLRPVLRDTP